MMSKASVVLAIGFSAAVALARPALGQDSAAFRLKQPLKETISDSTKARLDREFWQHVKDAEGAHNALQLYFSRKKAPDSSSVVLDSSFALPKGRGDS